MFPQGRSEHKRTFSLPGRGGQAGRERAREAREAGLSSQGQQAGQAPQEKQIGVWAQIGLHYALASAKSSH
jgi:hypothetical protein